MAEKHRLLDQRAAFKTDCQEAGLSVKLLPRHQAVFLGDSIIFGVLRDYVPGMGKVPETGMAVNMHKHRGLDFNV